MITCEIRTASAEETKAWGKRLARLLSPGAVIGLEGELGAGKTCFVKGLAVGLGLNEEEISSPTFTLIAEHYRGGVPLYHLPVGMVDEYLLVSFTFLTEDERVLSLTARGEQYEKILQALLEGGQGSGVGDQK